MIAQADNDAILSKEDAFQNIAYIKSLGNFVFNRHGFSVMKNEKYIFLLEEGSTSEAKFLKIYAVSGEINKIYTE